MSDDLLAVCEALVETTHAQSPDCEPNGYVCPHCDAEYHREFDGPGKLISEAIAHEADCPLVRARIVIANAKSNREVLAHPDLEAVLRDTGCRHRQRTVYLVGTAYDVQRFKETWAFFQDEYDRLRE